MNYLPEFQDPLILTVANHGFAVSGLILNWWISLDRVGLSKFAKVICLDVGTKEYLEGFGISVLLWEPEWFIDSSPVSFDSHGFKILTLEKLRVVASFFSGYKYILFSDADLVFLKNPLNLLDDLKGDIIFQSDAPAEISSQFADDYRYLCTGFYFLRTSEVITKLFDLPYNDIIEESNDQTYIQEKIQLFPEVTWKLLARNQFPNGSYWRAFMPKEAMIIHMNFCVGLQAKLDFLKMFGLWYV